MRDTAGLECFWSDLSQHPVCPHGPTLLFGKCVGSSLKQFYACSACRDRKLCAFYAEKDAKISAAGKTAGRKEKTRTAPFYNHRQLFVRFNLSLAQSPERRAYCHSCDVLVTFEERPQHADHDTRIKLSDEEMSNPTKILKPLADAKKEAQYLFSEKSTVDIINMLVERGAEQVLCVGAPRIHEYITQKLDLKVSSLLLDMDGRFHNFFGPLSYCWYNLFNHHFFTEEGARTFKDFLTQNNGKNTFLVCDPPFGGRVEPISQTIKTIVDQHRQWNNVRDESSGLKIVFVFPYFMESIMQVKSNPPGISGGLKDLKMSDYKVDYENHPLFVSEGNGRKHGSPVRIFTNIDLSTLKLPAEDGYKYCKKCDKWVSAENKHCKRCKACTSKDGRRYKHCKKCEKCVKPTWKHCDICGRCALEKHACDAKIKFTGSCSNCGGKNHMAKDCQTSSELCRRSSTTKIHKKRANCANGVTTVAKKRKSSAPR